MPYTVAVSFDRFIENISISGDQQQTCSARKDNIVSLLKDDFEILEAFASGSIPKRTAVQGSDLDVIVALHYGKHIKGKKPSEVLQSVRDSLGEHRTGVRKNGQAVTLGYKTWPNVDIVPVSRVGNDDGTISHYEVPDMNREEWIVSRPKKHSASMAKRASDYGPEFRRIVRMIKWWNKQHSSYLQSYHIEVLALEILTGPFDDYSWDIHTFFDRAHTKIQSSHWYEEAFVDDYLSWKDRQEAVKRLDTARGKSLSAWAATYDKSDDDEAAIELWRQIFGDKFPAYGS
jgi:hypothetical protein